MGGVIQVKINFGTRDNSTTTTRRTMTKEIRRIVTPNQEGNIEEEWISIEEGKTREEVMENWDVTIAINLDIMHEDALRGTITKVRGQHNLSKRIRKKTTILLDN